MKEKIFIHILLELSMFYKNFSKNMGFKFILEYSNDDRGNNSTDIFQNDLFLGTQE